MYNKIKCLNLKKEEKEEEKARAPSVFVDPITNIKKEVPEKVILNKDPKKKKDFSDSRYLKGTIATETSRKLVLEKKKAQEAKAKKPWWIHADMRTACNIACPNKKVPPKPRQPISCPNPFEQAYHHLPRIRHHLMLENNRLYCHQTLNKTIKPLKHVYRDKGICGKQESSAQCTQRAQLRMKLTLEEWMQAQVKRNQAYASNPIFIFHTFPQPREDFKYRNVLRMPTCDFASRVF